MRSDRERLRDIIEAIDRIARYTRRGPEQFENTELIQIWVIHHIEIIGEAARRVSPELRSMHPEVPWTEIVALRNVLAHDYFGIDVARVWVTVAQDLPSLRREIAAILDDLPA